MKKELLADDDRELAELHYKLALAVEFLEDLERASSEIKAAITVLNKRIEHSAKAEEGKGKGKATDAPAADGKEIQDMKELITDMNLKVRGHSSIFSLSLSFFCFFLMKHSHTFIVGGVEHAQGHG